MKRNGPRSWPIDPNRLAGRRHNTAKARAKLARLGEREAQAAEAERARAEALHQQADADMAARVAELAQEAVERLHMAGIDVAGTDAQTLHAYARTVARHEAEIQTAGHAFVLAQAKVEQVQDRITALSDRANALSALRLTGQATDRDAGWAVLIERDMQTLHQALTQAQSELARVQVADWLSARPDLTDEVPGLWTPTGMVCDVCHAGQLEARLAETGGRWQARCKACGAGSVP